MKKDVLWFLSAVLFIFTTNEARAETQTWDCGEKVNGVYDSNVKCTLTDDGVFTVSGNGKVADFPKHNENGLPVSDAPWGGSIDAMNKIKQIIVEDGISEIGNAAFCGARKAESIYMPSVKVVGNMSFYDPYKVQTIYMPEVETIGASSFAYAKELTSVDMPKVKEIGNLAFAGYFGNGSYTGILKYVGIPDGAVVEDNSFRNNPSVIQCGNGGSCGSCGEDFVMPGQGCASNCNEGYTDYKGRCWSELPFAKKYWTPSEAKEWLHNDSTNIVTITFKK